LQLESAARLWDVRNSGLFTHSTQLPTAFTAQKTAVLQIFLRVFLVFSVASRLDGFLLVFVPPPEKTLLCLAAPLWERL
jgi:hypothetical protein